MQRQVSRLCYQVCTCMFYRTKNSGGWGGGCTRSITTHTNVEHVELGDITFVNQILMSKDDQ